MNEYETPQAKRARAGRLLKQLYGDNARLHRQTDMGWTWWNVTFREGPSGERAFSVQGSLDDLIENLEDRIGRNEGDHHVPSTS